MHLGVRALSVNCCTLLTELRCEFFTSVGLSPHKVKVNFLIILPGASIMLQVLYLCQSAAGHAEVHGSIGGNKD